MENKMNNADCIKIIPCLWTVVLSMLSRKKTNVSWNELCEDAALLHDKCNAVLGMSPTGISSCDLLSEYNLYKLVAENHDFAKVNAAGFPMVMKGISTNLNLDELNKKYCTEIPAEYVAAIVSGS